LITVSGSSTALHQFNLTTEASDLPLKRFIVMPLSGKEPCSNGGLLCNTHRSR
jgi:hypothetical protein